MTMEFDTKGNDTSESAGGEHVSELAAAKALAEENHKKFLYAMADFENYKKRIERQFADISMSGRKALLLKFLPVLDNLERALSHDKDNDGLRNGLTATLKGFEAILGGEGVKAIALKGQAFDPKLAEAIGTMASADAKADTILEEPLRGYYIGDDVLRVAHVIVAKEKA